MQLVARQHSELGEVREKLGVTVKQLWAMLGHPMSVEAFRNYMYRTPPDDLIGQARRLLAERSTPAGTISNRIFQELKSKGTSKLKLFGSVGAGDESPNTMDDYALEAPAEFCRPEWGGLVVRDKATSAMPYVQPGDTIVLMPCKVIKLNKFMLISMNDDPSVRMLKCAAYNKQTQDFFFESANPDAAHVTRDSVSEEGCSIEGLLIGIISGDGRLKIGPHTDGIDREFIESYFRARLP